MIKRIESKATLEKRKKRNNSIIGILLIFILLISTIGYSFLGRSDSETPERIFLGEKEFFFKGEYYVSEDKIYLKNNPNKILLQNLSIKNISNYYEKPLYLAGEENEFVSFITYNLQGYVERLQPACIDKNCQEDYPIKSCENNIIILKKSKETQIFQENNCIFIYSNETEMSSAIDNFIINIFELNKQ